MVKKAFLAGAKGLEAKKDWINELNVFPVPDGDTGTNMTMTIMAAAKAVAELEDPDMEQLAKAISSGSLRGARGNSGVILSQLLRGFTKEIQGTASIDVTILANAMVRGTETAYKAVMKPKEGTILTVAKGMADKAIEMAAQTDDIEIFAKAVIEEGDYGFKPDTGDASCIKAGRRSGFRRSGPDAGSKGSILTALRENAVISPLRTQAF